jgi:hypothetical protein
MNGLTSPTASSRRAEEVHPVPTPKDLHPPLILAEPVRDVVRHHDHDENARSSNVGYAQLVVVLDREGKRYVVVPDVCVDRRALQLETNLWRILLANCAGVMNVAIDAVVVDAPTSDLHASSRDDRPNVRIAEQLLALVQMYGHVRGLCRRYGVEPTLVKRECVTAVVHRPDECGTAVFERAT